MLKPLSKTLHAVILTALLASGLARAREGQWRPLGPEGGSITALAIEPSSPQTVYAGTIGGSVFKSTNGGATWSAVREGLPGSGITALAIDPTTPQTIYAGTRDTLYKSINGGSTWSPSSQNNRFSVTMLAMDPINPQTLYAGYGSAYYKSNDGGETWNYHNSFPFPSAMAVDPTDNNILYACDFNPMGSHGLVYKSTDGGETWRSPDTSSYSSYWDVGKASHLIIDPTAPETIYASSGDFAARMGVFKTVNGNKTWSQVFSDDYVNALIMNPNASQTLYAGTENLGIFKTTDGGETWSPINSGLSNMHVLSLAIDPADTQSMYAGTRAGVFKSTDGGNNWISVNFGILSSRLTSLAIDPVTPTNIYAGGHKTGLYKSLDEGNSWSLASTELSYSHVLIVDPVNPQNMYALSDQALLKSINGGQNWTPASDGIDGVVQELAIAPLAPNTLYAASYNGGMYKSIDGAASWIQTNAGLSAHPYAIGIDPVNPGHIYVGTYENEVFKSTDSGESWVLAGALPADVEMIILLAVDPSDPQVLFAGTHSKGLFKSTDGGASWNSAGTGLGTDQISAIEFDIASRTAYAGSTGRGVFRSTNAGDTWSDISTGLAPLTVGGLKLVQSDPPILYAATPDGLWTYTTSPLSEITIDTNPPHYAFTVDGRTYYAPHTFSWVPGETHSISVPTPQERNETRHVFSNWDDGGSRTHTITVSDSPATYTASLTTQHKLTVSISPSNGGKVETSPVSTDGYFDSGTEVNLRAVAESGYIFSGWSGDLSGTVDIQVVTMSAPRSVTAGFTAIPSSNITIAAIPAGLGFVVDGISYTASQTFSWAVGSSHQVSVISPQGSGGTRFVFAGWSDGGATSHTIIVPADSTTFTANFTTQYLLTASVSPQAGGKIIVSLSSPDGYYESGSLVQLRAAANNGYAFSAWNGDLTGTTNPQSVTMSAPRNVTAAFRISGIFPSRLPPGIARRPPPRRDRIYPRLPRD